jgi:hypothetical protein
MVGRPHQKALMAELVRGERRRAPALVTVTS